MTAQNNAIKAFRALHESGCFVLPNPWDRGTAIFLQQAGYKALATTSAGLSFSRGLPDEVGAVKLTETLQHIEEIVSSTTLPVNADFQHGFAETPEGVANHVHQCIQTGIAGLSIEDATGQAECPLYPREMAIERIKAAKAAIDASGVPIVLTARCEAWLVGVENPFETVIDRLVAFAEAGADCLYAPGARNPEHIRTIIQAVKPHPVNVLASSADAGFSVPQLKELGVRRISVGSAMARTAWGAFIRAARSILEEGHFATFGEAATFPELNGIFSHSETPRR